LLHSTRMAARDRGVARNGMSNFFPHSAVWPTAVAITIAFTAFLSCSSEVPVGPPVQGYAGLYSLLALQSEMVVLEAPEDTPPEQRHIRPGNGPEPLKEPLPCVLMKAPSRVQYHIEEPPPGAVLQFALAIRNNGYRGQGTASFAIELNGETLFEHSLSCSKDVADSEKRWFPFDIPLAAGGDIVLKTSYEGSPARGPFVGFATLRIALPFEAERQRSSEGRPNIVLIVVDTLRADRLSCHGNERETSPTMDRLAREGLRCEQAYSSAPWTIPGTASVLTGLTPPEHGLGVADSNYLSDRLDSLPKVFAREGFTTGAITCNPLVDGSRNFDQGFESFSNRPWAPAPDIEQEVADWIAGIGEQRFFLYLHSTDPHAPYRATPEALARQGVVERDDIFPAMPREVVEHWYDGKTEDKERVERTCEHYLDVYDAEVDVTDHFVKHVLAELERAGLAENTILCITSDHGEEFLEHGLIGHFNQLFDESIHVPLILWGPGVPVGRVLSFPLENRHVAPTLLHLAGVPLPVGMRGPDLTSEDDTDTLALQGAYITSQKGRWVDFDKQESLTLGAMHSLVEGQWQLIHCPVTDPPGQGFDRLYDLQADPECRVDLAPRQPERVAAMRSSIEAWLASGLAARPEMVPTTEETRDLMRGLGYIGDE
jgi:arylsulfatase A-like enzyme